MDSVPVAGASQTCCYDFNGWLIFSQDYEYHPDYVKYSSAGTSHRAHPWGGYVFKKPPYVPSWSNFHNDLLPYDVCCRWAGHCEFYYWRRTTSGCQDYKPPRLATAYGHGHFITFDNLKYTFNGRGHFVLTSFKTPSQNLNIQIRMEQPPRTVLNPLLFKVQLVKKKLMIKYQLKKMVRPMGRAGGTVLYVVGMVFVVLAKDEPAVEIVAARLTGAGYPR
uniref:AMOP domain-containing protein n=1 Tax=Romanomermis culicivorax TaxID=13658 RepID=A0A915IXE0_ROMCU